MSRPRYLFRRTYYWHSKTTTTYLPTQPSYRRDRMESPTNWGSSRFLHSHSELQTAPNALAKGLFGQSRESSSSWQPPFLPPAGQPSASHQLDWSQHYPSVPLTRTQPVLAPTASYHHPVRSAEQQLALPPAQVNPPVSAIASIPAPIQWLLTQQQPASAAPPAGQGNPPTPHRFPPQSTPVFMVSHVT